MATKPSNLFKGKEPYSEELKEAKAIKSGKLTPPQYAKGEKSEEKMKSPKKYAFGGGVLSGNPALEAYPAQPTAQTMMSPSRYSAIGDAEQPAAISAPIQPQAPTQQNGYAKGGVVKGWGQARGPRAAKVC